MYKGEVGVVSCSPSLCNAAAPSTPINTASDAAGVTARAPLFLRTAPGSVEPGRMTAGCRALHTLGEERGGWEGQAQGEVGGRLSSSLFQTPAPNCTQLHPTAPICDHRLSAPLVCVQCLSGIGPRAISGGCGATSPIHH